MNQSHCGPNGFSPQAPNCYVEYPPRTGGPEPRPPNQVPEPDVVSLLLVAGVIAFLAKRKR